MITKDNFFKIFPFQGEEDIKSYLYEKYIQAIRTDKPISVKFFLTPKYWSCLEEFCQGQNIPYVTEGFFPEGERRLFLFNYYPGDEIIGEVIVITNKSKFKLLKHKDYLGSILALGIEREKLGDIVVKENKAYIAVMKDISGYIISNLTTIGKNPCDIVPLRPNDELPKVHMEECKIIVTSRRLDVIVAALANLSRNDSIKAIEQGKVLLNYIDIKEKSQQVRSPSTITIRGYGKYIIYDTVSNTKSGREVISVKKFI